MTLGELRVLDALLSQRELEHFDAADQIVVDVLLRPQLRIQLVDLELHLLLFEDEVSLARVR